MRRWVKVLLWGLVAYIVVIALAFAVVNLFGSGH